MASAEADMQCKSGVMETAAYQQTTYSKLSVAAQILGKEADVQALVEFNRALDKKVQNSLCFTSLFLWSMKEDNTHEN